MFLSGSWTSADVSLMIVFGVCLTCVAAIGVHLVRRVWAGSREVTLAANEEKVESLAESPPKAA